MLLSLKRVDPKMDIKAQQTKLANNFGKSVKVINLAKGQK